MNSFSEYKPYTKDLRFYMEHMEQQIFNPDHTFEVGDRVKGIRNGENESSYKENVKGHRWQPWYKGDKGIVVEVLGWGKVSSQIVYKIKIRGVRKPFAYVRGFGLAHDRISTK